MRVGRLQFSSGTTGLRKCVRITGPMLAHQVEAYARALRLSPGDCVASWLPLYHDMGLVACLLIPLYQGLPSAHLSPFEWLRRPVLLFQTLARYRATLAWLPNFAYTLCAAQLSDEEVERELTLGSLRAVINCSESVRAHSHERFLQRFAPRGLRPEHLQACYAMAEATFGVTQTEPGQPVRVVAFGVEDKAAGTEELILSIEPDGSGAPPEVLQRQIREQVWLKLNVPIADVEVCEPGSLLKSTSGKLSRSANHKQYLERRASGERQRRGPVARSRPLVEPRDLWERQLAWIWEEVLGGRPVGVEDDLFLELGAECASSCSPSNRNV